MLSIFFPSTHSFFELDREGRVKRQTRDDQGVKCSQQNEHT